MTPLQEHFRDLSRSRRAARRMVLERKAHYGETRYFSVHDPRPVAPTPVAPLKPVSGPVWRQNMIREQRNARLISGQQWRAKMLAAQKHRCYLCGDPFTADDAPTVDHVRPKGRHKNLHQNHLLAHYQCNHEKGSRDPTEAELAALRAVNEILYEWPNDTSSRVERRSA